MFNKLKTLSGGGGFRRLGLGKFESQSASSLFRDKHHKHKTAFTLAEILITISIIGVIAAITVPVVIPLIQERVDSYRHANIVHKITQATDVMKSLGELGKFESTDDFVDALEKHLKIMKRCDADHIVDCWPTEKIRTSLGKEYEVKSAKYRDSLGFKDANLDNKNVGIVLQDGASIIMTYNPDNLGLNPGDTLIASSEILPVGNGYKEYLEYTTNSTAGLAFVTDVNGGKKPNSETTGNKFHDIRSFNGAHFGEGCGGIYVDKKCYTQISSYSAFDCINDTTDNKYCNMTKEISKTAKGCDGNLSCVYSNDYWVGASIACEKIGGRLNTYSDLQKLCKKENSGITISGSGYVWASNLRSDYGPYAGVSCFNSGCSCNGLSRNNNMGKLLCISD